MPVFHPTRSGQATTGAVRPLAGSHPPPTKMDHNKNKNMARTKILLDQQQRRDFHIGVRATEAQHHELRLKATKCGMTLSTYLLSCGLGHSPRARLSERELQQLQNLVVCRNDLTDYLSFLRGMPQAKRSELYANYPFIIKWVKHLQGVAQAVREYLRDATREDTVPPSAKPSRRISDGNATTNARAL